ncbi:MAG: hypothetical protein H7839_01965 [Magnetococcus sp. YQC-5]
MIITLKDDVAPNKSGRVFLDDYCKIWDTDLLKIKNINEEIVLETLCQREIDWLFIIGWSQIAKQPLLNASKKGVLGIHPTLLPQGRGRASIPWAIIKGLSKTGVTLFKLDEGLDTGPIIDQEILPLAEDETATQLYERVNVAHRTLLRRVWPSLIADQLQLIPQDNNLATEWCGRKPEDGQITLDMSGLQVSRLVRATTHPYPGAFIDYQGKRYRLWSGCFYSRKQVNYPFEVDVNGILHLGLIDGLFDVTKWDVENII